MLGDTVNAPQLVEHLQLHAVLEQAIGLVPGETRGLR